MPNFKHEITIDRIACPLHVLQIKQGMKQIKSGEILKINSTAYVLPELLAAARQIGSSLSVLESKNEIFLTK
jgi:TusA-related sulfurtransferase